LNELLDWASDDPVDPMFWQTNTNDKAAFAMQHEAGRRGVPPWRGGLESAETLKPQRHACGGHRDSLRARSPSVMRSILAGVSAKQLRQQNLKRSRESG